MIIQSAPAGNHIILQSPKQRKFHSQTEQKKIENFFDKLIPRGSELSAKELQDIVSQINNKRGSFSQKGFINAERFFYEKDLAPKVNSSHTLYSLLAGNEITQRDLQLLIHSRIKCNGLINNLQKIYEYCLPKDADTIIRVNFLQDKGLATAYNHYFTISQRNIIYHDKDPNISGRPIIYDNDISSDITDTIGQALKVTIKELSDPFTKPTKASGSFISVTNNQKSQRTYRSNHKEDFWNSWNDIVN